MYYNEFLASFLCLKLFHCRHAQHLEGGTTEQENDVTSKTDLHGHKDKENVKKLVKKKVAAKGTKKTVFVLQ